MHALVCLAQPLQAEVVLDPPPTGSYAGAALATYAFFNLYYNHSRDPEFCVLSIRGAGDAFKRNSQTISKLAGPEQQVFSDYFSHQLVPYFARTSEGVEGIGSYSELIGKREESMRWLREHTPSGPAETPAEIAAYVATERAYLERAASDSAWVEDLFARSPCIRWAARSSGELPALGEFGIYRQSWVNDAAVRAKLRALRAPLLPRLTTGQQTTGNRSRVGKDSYASATGLGTALLTTAATVQAIDSEDGKAALVELWAAKLDPVEGARVREVLVGRREARAAAQAFFSERLDLMGLPPAAADQSALREAKALGAIANALSVRALTAMTTFAEDRTGFAGKSFARPVRFAGKTFTFAQVRRGAPWPGWPRGLGGDDVCSLVIVTAVYYSSGADVSLRKWQQHSDSSYPIACARRHATYGDSSVVTR